MRDVFGNVKAEGETYVSEYGVMTRIEAKILAKDKMDIATESRKGPMTDEEILDSKRKLNEFAEKATGFDAKARMKRAQKKGRSELPFLYLFTRVILILFLRHLYI